MAVTAATGTGAAPTTTGEVIKSKVLDQDAFLKLLLTELKSQDPSNTMDDKDFIAQLAQFSALEQTSNMATGLRNMATSNASTQAIDMIGKTVQYLDPSSGDEKTGKVDSIKLSSEGPTLMIGATEVTLSDIIAVDSEALNGAATQAISMIGKTVQYVDSVSEKTVEGVVSSVKLSSGAPRLMVGTKELSLGDIVAVQ